MLRSILILSLTHTLLFSAEIRKIEWQTEYASPPIDLTGEQEALMPFIRVGIAAMPEPAVMQFTFFGAATLGLPGDYAQELHGLLSHRYVEIAKDPLFSKVPSALSYCFSKTKPEKGLSTVYLPDGAGPETPVILFLHGYGGSFIYYLHYFATAFPDHIVICPAYGISTWQIPTQYLEETIQASSSNLGFKLAKPTLIGLSAGGFGGFREYFRNSGSYLGYICLAAFPPDDLPKVRLNHGRAVVIAGADEIFVKNGYLERAGLHESLGEYVVYRIPEENHFFMLTSEKITLDLIRHWMARFEE